MLRYNFFKSGHVYFSLGLAVLCFFGYWFQFFGLMSPTESNVAVFLLFTIFLIKQSRGLRAKKKSILASAASLLFVSSIVLSALINASGYIELLVYTYYAAVFFFTIKVAQVVLAKVDILNDSVWSWLLVFLFCQVLVVLVQSHFSAEISATSKTPVSSIDAMSGTLYISSDAALVFTSILVMVASFYFRLDRKFKFCSTVVCALLCLFAGSKAAGIVFVMVLPLLALTAILNHLDSRFKTLGWLLLFVGPVVSILVYLWYFSSVGRSIAETLAGAYYDRDMKTNLNRFAILGYIMFEEALLFGEGLLKYYNPITNDWMYYGGFSTLYSLYIDIGLVGVMCFYAYVLILIIGGIKEFIYRIIFILVFTVFSLFNFVLSDMLFVLLFFMIVQHRKHKVFHVQHYYSRY